MSDDRAPEGADVDDVEDPADLDDDDDDDEDDEDWEDGTAADFYGDDEDLDGLT